MRGEERGARDEGRGTRGEGGGRWCWTSGCSERTTHCVADAPPGINVPVSVSSEQRSYEVPVWLSLYASAATSNSRGAAASMGYHEVRAVHKSVASEAGEEEDVMLGGSTPPLTLAASALVSSGVKSTVASSIAC